MLSTTRVPRVPRASVLQQYQEYPAQYCSTARTMQYKLPTVLAPHCSRTTSRASAVHLRAAVGASGSLAVLVVHVQPDLRHPTPSFSTALSPT
eukprot:3278675-Rhodomonas_salina.1